MKTVTKIGLLALLLASVIPVRAATLSYSDTQVVPTYDGRFDPIINQPLSISQFNPALGTLNSVTLTMSGLAQCSFGFTNNSPGAVVVKMSENNTLSGRYNITSAVDQGNFLFQTTGYPSSQSVAASGGTYSQAWNYTLSAANATYTAPIDLSNFTGIGNAPLSGRFDCQFDLTASGGNNRWSVATSGSVTANVIYDYTPVPEPTSMALLLLTLGGLGCSRRFRH